MRSLTKAISSAERRRKVAHPINDAINKAEGREGHTCDDGCKYWKFPHLDTACELSDVFSVNKGELCYEYAPLIQRREEEE
jgi:hypothetical protein